jgi:hypothetical protein
LTAAVASPGTTAGGEKLADAPLGSPFALKLTMPVNGAPTDAMLSVYVAFDPPITVCCDAPLIVMPKSGMGPTAATTSAETLDRKFELPEYEAVRVCDPIAGAR